MNYRNEDRPPFRCSRCEKCSKCKRKDCEHLEKYKTEMMPLVALFCPKCAEENRKHFKKYYKKVYNKHICQIKRLNKKQKEASKKKEA